MQGLYTVRADAPDSDCISVAYSPRRSCESDGIPSLVATMRAMYPAAIVRVFDPNGNRDAAHEIVQRCAVHAAILPCDGEHESRRAVQILHLHDADDHTYCASAAHCGEP